MPPPGVALQTFTFRLPFVLGFNHQVVHSLELAGAEFVDPEDAHNVGRRPYVNIRIFNASLLDEMFWPANMGEAIRFFYNGDIGSSTLRRTLFEQWISLETPVAPLQGENPNDPAHRFHRCLMTFNLFLQALGLSRHDDMIRQISTRELRPIVVIGAYTAEGQWTYVTQMLMHPDAPVVNRPPVVHLEGLNTAMAAITNREPFIPSAQWAARARRRRYEGDAADAIVSFQIGVETLLYETWLMLLIDEGCDSVDISARLAEELPFKSLLVRTLHEKLGGNWDVTRLNSSVGTYWDKLYLLRNRMLHTGYQPHDGDADQAEAAFVGLVTFLEERLWANHKRFPRTLLAKLGAAHLQERGWMTAWMKQFVSAAQAEPKPFYWPRDVAGR